MNKYTLNCSFAQKDNAKNAGAIWQAYNKKWVYYGSNLPNSLAAMLEQTDNSIESTCNTCFCTFGEGEHDAMRQSHSNRGWLASRVAGKVVQECCERCAQDSEQEYEG